ncbi:MAG: hypothetical protein V5A30_03270, partial [Haloarculaceae archaeon]
PLVLVLVVHFYDIVLDIGAGPDADDSTDTPDEEASGAAESEGSAGADSEGAEPTAAEGEGNDR